MTLLIDKDHCGCDKDGMFWDADHKSYWYCPQHSVEGSRNITPILFERVEKIEYALKEIHKTLARLFTPIK